MSIFNSPQSEPPNRPSRRSKRLNKPKLKSKSYNNRKPKAIDNTEFKYDNTDNNNNNNPNSLPSPKSPSTPSLSLSPTTTKRKSKIFNIFGSPKSEPPPLPSCERLAQATSLPTIPTNTNKSRRRRNNKKHHRGSSENSGSQFEKLKSIISGLFPKKSDTTKPKKRRRRKKQGRSRSFSIRKNNQDNTNKNKRKKSKKKSKSKKSRKSNTDFQLDPNTSNKKRKKKKRANSENNMLSIVNTAAWMDDFNEESALEMEMERELERKIEMELEAEVGQESPFQSEVRKIKRDTMNDLITKAVLDEIVEVDEDDVDFSLSETEEYKDDFHDANGLPLVRPALAPKSSSCMRTFEKRPEYTTYYPPASLMEVFNNSLVIFT